MMPRHEVGPQPRRLDARRRVGRPLRRPIRHPPNFYGAISHTCSINYRPIDVKLQPLQRMKPLYPTAEALGLYGLVL